MTTSKNKIGMAVEALDHMTPAEEKRFWATFEYVLASDDGHAAKAHLADGRPIYYRDDRYDVGYVRKWPDGRLELVTVDEQGCVTVLRALEA